MKSLEKLVHKKSNYYTYSPSIKGLSTFLYPLQVGHFYYNEGYRQVRSSYDSFLLMFIPKGSLTITYDNCSQEVCQNQFVLLDCYVPHGYYSQKKWEAYWIHFDGITARAYYEQIIEHHGHVFSLHETYVFMQKFQLIYDSFQNGTALQEALIGKYLIDILTEFLVAPTISEISNYSELIGSVISYISEHLQEDLTIEQLSAIISLSPYHFIRIFKQETGFTPHEYIIKSRMNTARFLLSSTSMSVKEICYQVGFRCESVFCTAFKNSNGVTPTTYRKSTIL